MTEPTWEALTLAAEFLAQHDPAEEGSAEFADSLACLLDLVAVSAASEASGPRRRRPRFPCPTCGREAPATTYEPDEGGWRYVGRSEGGS